MIVRQQSAQLLVVHQLREELARYVGFEQPIAILREHGRHPYRLVNADPTNQR
jgi:hypothetical protein